MKKRFFAIFTVLCLALCLSFAACTENETGSNPTEKPADSTDSGSTEDPTKLEPVPASERFSKFDTNISYDPNKACKITFNGDSVEINGNGAEAAGCVVTVKAAGTYILSGTGNGQVVVTVDKAEKVQLVLNGLKLTNPNQSAIYVTSADKVAITLVKGTVNELTDGKTYTGLNDKDEPNACVFSKDDLTINGYGSLNVNALYNNGIASKNDLKIVSGEITVKAPNNAIKGKYSFQMNAGTVSVDSLDDGIKVTEDGDPEKGFIAIEGGNLTIKAGDDGLTAVTGVTVTGGTVTTICDGKSVNCDASVSIADGCLIEK